MGITAIRRTSDVLRLSLLRMAQWFKGDMDRVDGAVFDYLGSWNAFIPKHIVGLNAFILAYICKQRR